MRRMLIVLLASLAFPAMAQSVAPEAAAPFGNSAVETTDLAAITGREDTAQVIQARNTSTVSNNSVTGQSETGAISFDAGSFQAMAGLSLLSANTGNNVSINSSLNLNVAISPR